MASSETGGEVLLKSKKFTVRRQQIDGSDGKKHAHDVVVHPGAAVVLPIMNDGRLLFIRNERPSVGRTLLELPAGTLDEGEKPRDCAARELEEETGYKARKVEHLASFYSTPGFCNELMHAFVAVELEEGKEEREPTEKLELAPMSFADAMQAAGSGGIEDAKTLATLLYYAAFRRAGEGR